MDPNTDSHYRIEVYDDGPPPDNEPQAVSLCPGARGFPVELVLEVPLVTCRRCLQLLDVIGLRPIQGYRPE